MTEENRNITDWERSESFRAATPENASGNSAAKKPTKRATTKGQTKRKSSQSTAKKVASNISAPKDAATERNLDLKAISKAFGEKIPSFTLPSDEAKKKTSAKGRGMGTKSVRTRKAPAKRASVKAGPSNTPAPKQASLDLPEISTPGTTGRVRKQATGSMSRSRTTGTGEMRRTSGMSGEIRRTPSLSGEMRNQNATTPARKVNQRRNLDLPMVDDNTPESLRLKIRAPRDRGNTNKTPSQNLGNSSSFNGVGMSHFADTVWTKNKKSKKQGNATTSSGKGVSFSPVQAVSGAASAVASKASSGKTVKVVAIIIAVLIVFGLGDMLINGNKIYAGVSVGSVELAGKTKEEATQLLQETYGNNVSNNSLVFYANNEAKNNADNKSNNNGSLDEQLSYEDAAANRKEWVADANSLGARFLAEDYANQAFEMGRGNGGIFTRFAAQLFGKTIIPECDFSNDAFESLRIEMTDSVGQVRSNWNISMENGVAQVVEGHDGNEVQADWMREQLNTAFLNGNGKSETVLQTEYMPLQINKNAAQACADKVNASIAQGATFKYNDSSWTATRDDLSGWISTEVVEEFNGYQLKPVMSEALAKNAILNNIGSSFDNSQLTVNFYHAQDNSVWVKSNASGTVPDTAGTINSMNDSFFTTTERKETPDVTISSTELKGEMPLSDAIDYGVVGEIGSFTTKYSSAKKERTHNIHTAADYLTNSICPAGGVWSFNDTAGEATEERGYMGAGAIVAGEYSDAVGGGICQVATTVYNVVYEAGYPIKERHNHSLYIASYPAGRDAAIAFPDLDLRWENDTQSDVLLVMSYTDSTITAKLYGVSPNYQVSTEYGEWKKGKAYSTKYRTDNTMKSGSEYIETEGSDGRTITIVRTVKDAAGAVLHKDEFTSEYAPKNKVIVKGGS